MTGATGNRPDAIVIHAGPRLTVYQRAILVRLVVQLHAVGAVRNALEEEYPEFPVISDDLIRYYRRKIEADINTEAQTIRDLTLRTGLAKKAVRISHLIRMANQWRKVPLVETVITTDNRRQRLVSYRTRADASRELREILKQIAQELGQLMPTAQPPVPRVDAFNVNDDLADEKIRTDLEELLRSMTDPKDAT